MTENELKAIDCTSIEELITEDFGAPGTPTRDQFDRDAEAFILAERLKGHPHPRPVRPRRRSLHPS